MSSSNRCASFSNRTSCPLPHPGVGIAAWSFALTAIVCRCPPEFRRKVLDLLKSGRTVTEVSSDLDVTEQAIYNWRNQELIDPGQKLGLSSIESGRTRRCPTSYRRARDRTCPLPRAPRNC
ncbi:transposase [Rhodococcus erythropolis]|uniref:transposase n=1 Tax=Rhodococcus erythropolis TaxID=1833 RepID=UPI003982A04C